MDKKETNSSINKDNKIQNALLSNDLAMNLDCIQKRFNNSCDLVFREFYFGKTYRGTLIYFEEFVDIDLIDRDLLSPLLNYNTRKQGDQFSKESFKFTLTNLIRTLNITWSKYVDYIINCLLSQHIVILFEKMDEAVVIRLNRNNTTERGISEPPAEKVIRGPKDGFTENILTNRSLIRKRLKTPDLVMEEITVGRQSNTKLSLSYIKDIAKEDIVKEVFDRLSFIDTDAVLSSAYIEDYIEDNPYSPFPQVGNTERPDIVCAHLLEGHVSIMLDNSPTALIVPHTFFNSLQINEDYYERPIVSSFVRFMRFLFLGVSLLLPAVYIAVETFHHEMISTKLLISMAKSREGIPFPAYFEALFMAIFLEALRESAIRLPQSMGQTVSIVGALVIGEVAIRAGIVSDTMVLVIGITAVSTFTLPKYSQSLTIRFLRFFLMLLAAFLGLYGVLIGFYFLLTHMCRLTSFGVSYLYPLAPLDLNGLKDIFFRLPKWLLNKRPSKISSKNNQRNSN